MSSSSSSTPSRTTAPTTSSKFASTAKLARELGLLLDSLASLRIRLVERPVVADFTANANATKRLSATVEHADDDDDDNDDDVSRELACESDWSSVCDDFDVDDAPHPADERHWFSAAEEHAFLLAGDFDRVAPRQRHASARHRSNAMKRTGRAWLPSARYADSERLSTESALVGAAATPAQTVVMPRPQAGRPSASAEEANVQRAVAESRRQMQDASRMVDANLAATVGLSAAQLAAMLTRELTPADYELLLALDNAVAAKTIKKDELAELLAPVAAVSADDVCAICFDELAAADLSSLRQLPCSHAFHQACITKHLGEFSRRCPTCNVSLEK
jgi:hypothetical protein